MNPRDLIIESATAASGTVGTQDFMKLARHALTLTGEAVSRHITGDDRPGLFAPVDVVQDGKDRIGSILALEDRAILAWTVGSFRMKSFETVVPYGSISKLELTTRSGGPMSKDREVMIIEAAGERWQLVFANVFEGGRSIAPFLKGTLDGSIKPVFREE